MELGTVRQINIDAEMQASYLDYAMSVIVARALPDVRDGLKPVHRRILYAMHDLGLRPDLPYKKSARIVGEVLGKYHPHGDAAVYEAMVRMAQDFSLRYPLVDGQGNFGSIDGDNAAAMRYTEARLAKIAMEMLNDIEKNTVEWTDNFDGTLKEPTVLPAALPNLVVNGSSGIAVGMSTNIPPHNLGEVCDALCYLIDNYDKRENVTIEDIMKFIPGPDFPTGGVVFRYGAPGEGGEREDLIAKAYASGRGHITVQARAHIEDMSRNRSRIVVTELPYAANKTNIIERIAELAREGRIEGLTDLRDESDRTGMRLCIEMTRTVEPRDILAHLYKHTPLQQTFGISLLALVDGEPRLLSLKRLLLHFLEHRQEVITRRAKHDLAKAKQRAHILEGLLKALDILDEVIALIRGSRTVDIARQGLMKQLGFSEIQAQAILDMQLRRLAALERRRLQDEYREVTALIKELEALLGSPKKVLALIRQNLLDLKATYGDARRTQITEQARGALTVTDVLPDEEAWVTLRTDGSVGRAPGRLPAGDGPLQAVLDANTHCDLYLVNTRGQATRVSVHQLPDGASVHHAVVGGLRRGIRIAVAFTARKPNGEPLEGQLVLATARGAVKRINLAELASAAQANPTVIKLDENDELVWGGMSNGGGEIMLATAGGQVIRFAEDEVRAMGLAAGGIAGIKLQSNDRVIGGAVLGANTQGHDLALVTGGGFGRRSALSEFPTKGRGTQGVGAKLSAKGGPVVSTLLVTVADRLLVTTRSGQSKPVAAKALPRAARTNTGKVIVVLAAGEQVERVVLLPPDGEPGADRGGTVEAAPKRATRSKRAAEAPVAALPQPEARPKEITPAPVKATPAATKTTSRPAQGAASPTAIEAPTPAATVEAPTAPAPARAAGKREPAKEEAPQAPQPEREEVTSRRGKPAVLARAELPTGSGQLALIPAEPPAPTPVTKPARGKAKTEAEKPAATKARATKPPAAKAKATTPATAKVEAPKPAPTKTRATEPPAAKAAETTPATAATKARATRPPAAKSRPTKPPAAKAEVPKKAATKQAEAKPGPQPAARKRNPPGAAVREADTEFEPRPKPASRPPNSDEPDQGLKTVWSPSPPRRADEPPSSDDGLPPKRTRKR